MDSVIPTRASFLLLLLLPVAAFAQVDGLHSPYLLRLEHKTFNGHACAMLQESGVFHLEWGEGDSVKVAEGKMQPVELGKIEDALREPVLDHLTQNQIEEPLLRTHDILTIDIFRRDHWQDVIFSSAQSQEPYRRSLQPLLRWLDDLHKFPHKDLSENEGRNNCLLPKKIALTTRGEKPKLPAAHMSRSSSPEQPAGAAQKPTEITRAGETPVPVMLRLFSMSKKSAIAEERCLLVKENGAYRRELRVQQEGSGNVRTKIYGGMMTAPELSELREILDEPALSSISHHKTSRLVLPMSGEMLQLQIPRPSGVQEIVLSTTFARRDVPFFYSGDGAISSAGKLLQFLNDHVENHQSGSLDPHLRNQCTEAR